MIEAEKNRKSAEEDRTKKETERAENEEKRAQAEENRAEETKNAIAEIKNLNEDYKDLAEEKTAELNDIAEGVKNMATAIQFANFKINKQNMHLQIITAKKLGNTSFTLNKKTGRLGVRIVNGK